MKNLPVRSIDEIAAFVDAVNFRGYACDPKPHYIPRSLLEQELWGIKNGVYVPVGVLRLPLCGRAEIREDKNNQKEILFWTLFEESFANPSKEIEDDYQVRAGANMWEGTEFTPGIEFTEDVAAFDSGLPLMLRTDASGKSSVTGIAEHVRSFFRLYALLPNIPMSNDSRRILNQCFQEYK